MDDLISRQAAVNETWREPRYTDPLNVLLDSQENRHREVQKGRGNQDRQSDRVLRDR